MKEGQRRFSLSHRLQQARGLCLAFDSLILQAGDLCASVAEIARQMRHGVLELGQLGGPSHE